MRSFEQQVQAALVQATPLAPLELSLREASGCVTATEVTALMPIPSFDSADYAGYAVLGEVVASASPASPVRLTVDDTVDRGFVSTVELTASNTVRVGKGALLPARATAVVPVAAVVTDESDEIDSAEMAAQSVGGGFVDVVLPVSDGVGVVSAGSSRVEGSRIVDCRTRLGDRHIAAVAAAGHSRVSVHPEPRVVIVTVGDDLVDVSRALAAGLVYDVAAAMLVAAADRAGATTFRGGPSRRDIRSLATTIQDQLVRADLIVIVGEEAADANPHDGLVARALKDAGCQDLDYCFVEPGPVIGFGTIGSERTPVVTVGSSVLAAFVGFEVMARPVIASLAGREGLFRPVVKALVSEQIAGYEGHRQFLPAVYSHDSQGQPGTVLPISDDEADASLWLQRVNALVILGEDVTEISNGTEAPVIRLDVE